MLNPEMAILPGNTWYHDISHMFLASFIRISNQSSTYIILSESWWLTLNLHDISDKTLDAWVSGSGARWLPQRTSSSMLFFRNLDCLIAMPWSFSDCERIQSISVTRCGSHCIGRRISYLLANMRISKTNSSHSSKKSMLRYPNIVKLAW